MMKKNEERIAILGGGLSGVAFGAALKKKGISFNVFEANDTIGGLARTLKTGDFSWDLGVHALYSRDSAMNEVLTGLPLAYQYCDRNVHICHVRKGKVYQLDYPFENGLRDLPEEDLKECLQGYKAAYESGRRDFTNLADWIDKGLGKGFSRVFMTPYNKKIWNAPLNEISMDLVSGKIEPQPYEEILKNARGTGTVGRSYQARFVYPKAGIQEFCDCFAGQCVENIRTGMQVSGIKKKNDVYSLEFTNGETHEGFDRLVSTIPLTTLTDLLPYDELGESTSDFRHNSTLFILVGLKASSKFNAFGQSHWSFFAGDEIFYRLTMMHTFSDRFPQACVAEYTVKDGESVDEAGICDRVVHDLALRGIINSVQDIQTVRAHFEKFTYPIPCLGTLKKKQSIRKFLAEKRIDLLGRNGRWDYINMDQVLKQVDLLQAEF